MESILRKAIAEECDKHIDRYNEYLFFLDEDIQRRDKRLGVSSKKAVGRPAHWSLARAFDPFKTRYRIETYAHTIARKLASKAYQPQVSAIMEVPKSDGSTRSVNIFQLPDAALSRIAYKSLLKKNVARFSSYAYAYREDRLAHDAIKEIAASWRNCSRIYVAEFDFSKFFDNINHQYLWDCFNRYGFTASQRERAVVSF